jgi:hypothetical protein
MNLILSFSSFQYAFKGRIAISNAAIMLKNAPLSLGVVNAVLSNNFRIRIFLYLETVAKTVIKRLFSLGSALLPSCGVRRYRLALQ